MGVERTKFDGAPEALVSSNPTVPNCLGMPILVSIYANQSINHSNVREMKNKINHKSLNSPVKHSKITPLSLMYSANSLLKFKLYEHLIVITMLACGQRGAVQVCAMETGGAEADTSRWVTTRLSQNQNSVRTVEGVSLFHPSETSRQSQIPALSGDVSVVKYDKKSWSWFGANFKCIARIRILTLEKPSYRTETHPWMLIYSRSSPEL